MLIVSRKITQEGQNHDSGRGLDLVKTLFLFPVHRRNNRSRKKTEYGSEFYYFVFIVKTPSQPSGGRFCLNASQRSRYTSEGPSSGLLRNAVLK